MGSVTLLAEFQHETICCTNVFPVSEWQYIGCSVQGSTTMARSNIRAKSSLTSGGLSCRLAWQTVSVNQKEFWRAAAALQTGMHAGNTNWRGRARKLGVLRFVRSLASSFTAVLHLWICSTPLACPRPTDPVSECCLFYHPSILQIVHKSRDHLSG